MVPPAVASQLQNVIDAVEDLSDEDQALLIQIVYRRLAERRRARLVAEVAEARADYKAGRVRVGDIDDLLRDLSN